MGIPIDRELAGDINNPSFEVLNYCIKEHEKTLERLNRLEAYYNGEHDILKRSKTSSTELTNVMINNAKYVTDINTGFTVGNPVAYSSKTDKSKIDPVLDAYEEMDIVSHDTELEKDLSVFGYGYELHYLRMKPGTTKNETEPMISKIDPRGIFLVTDDTVEKNPLFAVHYMEKFKLDGSKNGWLFNVYTEKWMLPYKSKNKVLEDGDTVLLKVKPNYYGAVPVLEARNNEEKQGDFEQAISLIDSYNMLQSDRINDKEAFIDAILITYGFSLQEDEDYQSANESKSKSKGMHIEAPSKQDGADADYLTKTFDESQIDILSKSIEDNIHKVTYTPNLNDEKFAGNISGEAMKYKLFGLLQLLSTKQRYFTKVLRQRLILMQNILNVKGKNVDVAGAKITMKPYLPVNVSDIIKQISDSQEFIPLLISLGWLPDIDNPEEVLELLKKQKEQNIEIAQKAAGVQAEDSHSELDEPPSKKEDKTDDNSNVQKEK